MIRNFSRLIIKNPILLRESLITMLALIKPHITSYQLESSEEFISQLPDSVRAIPINITTDCRIDLISCLCILWKVDSSIWLSIDVKNQLIEFENLLRRAFLIQVKISEGAMKCKKTNTLNLAD